MEADYVDQVNALASLLSLDGHTIEVAYSAQQALERLQIFRPAVALLDIGLQEIDGDELADRIHADPQLSCVSLIAMTGWPGRGPQTNSQPWLSRSSCQASRFRSPASHIAGTGAAECGCQAGLITENLPAMIDHGRQRGFQSTTHSAS